ncbi:zinc finger mym-type protein 2-like: PROVISIONAL [Gigaspora margarita]|uniref:Zinc finger mym-type protein 2-like: PROVISIONAL n=1 Tax=Gigaspora margarita TaxID=4874 RepID=A0A8H3XEH9_GIGMA|nr:zinc finger mym-type protein 2-like: PROVISIONAL [Gigaspora margarita]
MSKTDARFVSTTKEVISEFQQASRNVNTDKSRTVWMSLFTKFRELRNYSNEIIELDNKTLSDQLEQFIVEIRKLNDQEYKAPSLYSGFCALVREISEMFEETWVINLFDKINSKVYTEY